MKPVSTLYVDRKDIELRHVGGVVELHESTGRRGSIPLAGLTRVVLHGRVQLSTSVIGAFVDAGVCVVLLGGRRSRYLATCIGKTHNDVQRRIGQHDAYRDDAAREGRAVLLNKQTRARFYEHFSPLGEALRRLLRRQVRSAARTFEQRAKTIGRAA